MSSLSAQRCHNHPHREAVARCPVCDRFYCRECIVEHAGRMICAQCLAPERPVKERSRLFCRALRGCQLAAGMFLLWLVFFLMGRALLNIPSSFHDGTYWSSDEGD